MRMRAALLPAVIPAVILAVTLAVTLAAILAAILPGAAAQAAEPFVTIGYLPLSTREEAVMVRGAAPRGSVVDVAINGEIRLRVVASAAMDLYRSVLDLEPGENRIVVTVEGTAAQAQARIFRTTAHFTDLDDHWARSDVEILATLGVVNGLGDGTFGPDATLSRAQFAKLLMLGLRLEPALDAYPDFADGAAIPAWARGYVAGAVSQGLIRGYADGSFRPDAPVTRGEVVVMAARAIRLQGAAPVGPPIFGLPIASTPFTDWEAIPAWVQPDLALVLNRKLIDPRWWGDSFRAGDVATRAQAAAVIRRLYTADPGVTR